MEELVKIEKQEINNEEVNSVNARDLWLALESKQEFIHWIKARLEQSYAIENEDYCSFDKIIKREKGAVKIKEYALSLDLAKNIAMLERNEKGSQIRKYFIACEKQLKAQTPRLPQTYLEALESLVESEKRNQALQAKIDEDKPKVEFFDAVADSKDAISIGEVAKTLNMGIGRNRLFEILRNKGILQADNIPYQKYIDAGYFRVIEQKYTRADGETHISLKTLVYQKGLNYIRRVVEQEQSNGEI